MKKPFELIPCPGADGRRGWCCCNVPGVAMSARVHYEFVCLSELNVDRKGKGKGSLALMQLVVWAFQRGLEVRLHAEAPLSHNQARLERWYQRMGFKRLGKTREFVIKPKR